MTNITRRAFLRGSAIVTGAAASIGIIGTSASREPKLTVTKAPSHSMKESASQDWGMEFHRQYMKAARAQRRSDPTAR